MAQVVPSAKLIYLVRDPVEKVLRTYRHARSYADWNENRGLAAAVCKPENTYVEGARYYKQISHYARHFDYSSIMVVTSESLETKTEETMSRVYKFLGVSAEFKSPVFRERLNVSSNRLFPNALGIWANRACQKWTGVVGSGTTSTFSDKRLFPILNNNKELGKIFGIPTRLFYTSDLPRPTKTVLKSLKTALKEDMEDFRAITNRSFDEWSI
ncbi:MAG: sulfotransferase [Okeania sp. SIO1H5]|nr:sulfotransferase [Okeania sp. SIO1H5]